MKQFLIRNLDPLKYEILKYEEPVGGSRPRMILKHRETRQRFFLKTYAHNTREIWAELLASKIGELIGLDIQKVSIKIIDEPFKKEFQKTQPLPKNWVPLGASVIYAFPRDFDIIYGQMIIGEDKTNLKLNEISELIEKRYYAPKDILEKLSDMIIFDAFIGNMDRHHENWGILEHIDIRQSQLAIDPKVLIPKRKFATLFDHGSSLLFELEEKNVEHYLSDIFLFEEKYINSNIYTFFLNSDGKPDNIFNIIEWYIKNDGTKWGAMFKKSIKNVLSNATLFEIAKMIFKMPNHDDIFYTENRKRLLFESFTKRMNKLKSILL